MGGLAFRVRGAGGPPVSAGRRRRMGWLGSLVALVALWTGAEARAHKVSDSFLRLTVSDSRLSGQMALALHDLEFAVGLDGNEDGAITWGELRGRGDAVRDYARRHLGVEADGRGLELRFLPDLQVDALANGTYAVLRWEAEAPDEPRVVGLEYRLFFDENRLHRGLVVIEHGGKSQQAVFNPLETRLRFDLERPRPWREFGRFVWEGVWHIGIGYDHVLFLIVLLLPSVLRRENGGWHPVENLRGAFLGILKVVTAFTVAHSITLSLAALEWVRLPSRWVESVIAVSIVVAALNNLRPVANAKTWALALAFGLVHGFGFASVLGDLGLSPGSLVRALVGFNLGVELGQIAIVSAFLPLAYPWRAGKLYRHGVLRWGSGAAAALATVWLVQRVGGG